MGVLDLFSLKGQIAVVTGGGKGIGRGIALALAEAGADVAVAARSQGDIADVADEIRKRGQRAIAVQTDVTQPAQLERLASETEAQLGTLSIWVNNAGGLPDATSRYMTRTSHAEFAAQIDLNLTAVFTGATIAAVAMREAGGSIINISSRSAFGAQRKNGPYAASKAAVNSMTQTLSDELAPKIRVNAVAPGPVPTQNFLESTRTPPDKVANLEKAIGLPLQRFGTGEDIGAAVVFMASPAASWVTGQCLYVTGGL